MCGVFVGIFCGTDVVVLRSNCMKCGENKSEKQDVVSRGSQICGRIATDCMTQRVKSSLSTK